MICCHDLIECEHQKAKHRTDHKKFGLDSFLGLTDSKSAHERDKTLKQRYDAMSPEDRLIERHMWTALRNLESKPANVSQEKLLSECQKLDDLDRNKKFILDGLIFVYPFVCLCCGVQIDANQWGFGRACGRCDCGHCGHKPWTNHGQRPWPIYPHVMRFPDGEIVQIDIEDMMKLRRMRIWGR